jgi:hypothetical protein
LMQENNINAMQIQKLSERISEAPGR